MTKRLTMLEDAVTVKDQVTVRLPVHLITQLDTLLVTLKEKKKLSISKSKLYETLLTAGINAMEIKL